ncbi:MAG: response regulator [Candidatus Obscuribacterales bacterium]|nr:response regulator [Candidatus Obscuribacterales bacterium]
MSEKLSAATSKLLQETFVAEAREQIQKIVDNLIKLESCDEPPKQSRLVELTFRELHNLKGSARAVEYTAVEVVCHPLEDVMAALKRKQIKIDAELLDLVLSSICLVEKFLDVEEQSSLEAEAQETRDKVLAFMKKIGLQISASDQYMDEVEAIEPEDLAIKSVQVISESNTPQAQKAESPKPAVSESAATKEAQLKSKESKEQKAKIEAERVETLRIPAVKLDSFMQKAEEMLSVKAMARQQRMSAQALQSKLEERLKAWSKAAPDLKAARVLMEKMRSLNTSPQEQVIWRKMNDILDLNSEFIESLNDDVKTISRTAFDFSHATSTAVDVLLDETKRLLMMPCGTVFEGFPLVVRQLARELGKEVEVNLVGGDIELDKRILSQVKDPLLHLLRNSVDHGMETPEERESVGKARRGNIGIKVSQIDGTVVEMRVFDDGRGINTEKVKQSAIRLGLISSEEAAKMGKEESLALIFKSQLSTSQIITEISGRGIGLAVVDENIRKLGGRIRIETEPGKGSSFIITLPVTIATFRGVLVDVASKTFVVPTTSIDRVVRIKNDAIKPVEGNNTMLLGDSLIPVCHMEDVLELPSSSKRSSAESDKLLTVAILGSGDDRMGFVVDEVLEEHEVLVKSLGQVFTGVRNVSGVTILGSGKVVPILNSSDMLKWSRKHTFMRARRQSSVAKTAPHAKNRRANGDKRILVVDDTLTARILLRNIFESAGFSIKTANDGAEALDTLKSENFDLVVTDIEMPIMNGFELTEQIRRDDGLSDIPVIMVTSMTSREDRERGVSVGANAYFVKSSFDQSNLLDVIATLI